MLTLSARFSLALAVAAFLGCSDTTPPLPPPPPSPLTPRDAGGFPRYDEAFQFATHNSYWVDRGVQGDAAASGVGERLFDQLLFDHARAIEIDIHRSEQPRDFRVYHTVTGNSLCDTLAECLGLLRAFHRALPEHEVVTVILELKEVTASNFDAAHTIEDLDRILVDELGELLYRPKDLFVPCEGHEIDTLAACAEGAFWPGLGEMRGRFVVAILGNWDAIGGQGTRDWVDYATQKDIRTRAAFPMASSWKLAIEQIPPKVAEQLTQDELDAAFAQSVLLQVEDTADPRIVPFLARRGVIRINNAFTVEAQASVIASGMQLLQTDTPWIQVDDRGMQEPLRPLLPGVAKIVEPGERLVLAPGAFGERVFAYTMEPETSTTTWETTVSSGTDATAVGCVRAAEALGDDTGAAAIMVCRRKMSGQLDPAMGGAKGTADAERVFIDIEVCAQGTCTQTHAPSEDGSLGGPGDTLSVVVDSQMSGMSCVTVQSALLAERDLTPRWANVGSAFCVGSPLPYQGLAHARAMGSERPVAFFRTTRKEGNGTATSVRGQTFAGVVVEPIVQPAIAAPMKLEDASTP
jgi:hypothetical protein